MLRQVKQYAAINRLIKVHPLEKIIFCFISLIMCSNTEKKLLILMNIGVFLYLSILNKNPYKIVCKFIIIAMTFTLISSVTLALNKDYLIIPLVFLRTLNGSITISYLALTTPMNHIVMLLSKNKYTKDIGEIANSMESFLLLIEDDFIVTMKAMKVRGAFWSYKEGIINLGKAIGVVFRNLMRRWSELSEGLKNRCYIGRHNFTNDFKFNILNITIIVIYGITFIFLN